MGLKTGSASGSFICQEPGGKRLIQIDGNNISKPGGKTLIFIHDNDLLVGDVHVPATLVVDDDDVRPAAAGVKIANFDGEDLRHGPSVNGKVLINYRHPDLSPTAHDNRIYSIEGDALTKQQLVAGLYLLKPEMFKLTAQETAAQQKAMTEAGAEADRLANSDKLPGAWTVLNGYGPVEHIGGGFITFAAKKGDAYPVTVDHSKSDGPNWTGVAVQKEISGDHLCWIAYGTPKTVGLCVYEINGGTLSGKWYPWYIDGSPKNTGVENLEGPASLDGEFTIKTATAPYTGAAYTGTVAIKPLEIVGAGDWAKPYAITWKLGTITLNGIGVRTGNFLFVASGSGADVNIARYQINNGTMNGNWFKLGSTDLGGAAAMSP